MLSPQMIAGALQLAAQLGQSQQQHDKELALARLRQSALSDMVDAFVTRRVDAVQAGFNRILDQFADQARHFMEQQRAYSQTILTTVDPITRVELDSRLRAIDMELAGIRTDIRLVFDRMSEVILALGGARSGFSPESLGLLHLGGA